MAQTTSDTTHAGTPGAAPRGDEPDLGDVVDTVKAYAKQETIGQLQGAGRWLAYGAAGAMALGLGLVLIMLGLLRLIQTEWDDAATGRLSWLPYVIVIAVAGVLMALTLSRVKKNYLNKDTD